MAAVSPICWRFSRGEPDQHADADLRDHGRGLLGTLGNGVNNQLLDTPQISPGPLRINTNPRNGQAAFNTGLFAPETLGHLENSARRIFYGPGLRTLTYRSAKRCILLNPSRLISASRRSTCSTTPVLRSGIGGWGGQRFEFRTRGQRGRSAPGAARREIQVLAVLRVCLRTPGVKLKPE